MSENTIDIHAGFMALNDASPLIIAKEKGFAEKENINLYLHKETSWATLRDRLAVGHFDIAHLLAPMPIAAACDAFPINLEITVPMSLGLGGNAITLCKRIWRDCGEPDYDPKSAAQAGRVLKEIVHQRELLRKPKLKFAVVHPFSSHNYELRYWLSASGIDPENDILIVVLAPTMLSDALAAGIIDGFCVGEPWNSIAIKRGAGVLLTTKSAIWRSSPEKILAIANEFLNRYPEESSGIIRAVYAASKWIENPENYNELASIVSKPEYLDVNLEDCIPGFSGNLLTGLNEVSELKDLNFYISNSKAAFFPWKSHAIWFYAQAVRWGQIQHTPENLHMVENCFSPNLLRKALDPLKIPLPSANSKIEGSLTDFTPVGATVGELYLGPDGFFDGELFDPENIEFPIKND